VTVSSRIVDDLRAQLRRANARYRRTDVAHQAAQQALVEVVVAALEAGIPPSEVVELSGFGTTYVRKIAREHGVPPAPLGRKSRQPRS
jgi:nucleoid DNA-binding protein